MDTRHVALTWALLCGLIGGFSSTAQAQEPRDFDVQNFRPAMDSQSFITIERSKILGMLDPSFGLYLNYAFSPLTQTIDGKEVDLISSLGTGNLVAALGFGVAEIGINVPVVIVRGDPDGEGDAGELAGDGLGDVQFSAKVRILDRETMPVGVAVVGFAGLGNGEANTFASHGEPTFGGRLVLDIDASRRLGIALNAGARIRARREINQPITITDADTGDTRQVNREDPIIAGNEATFGLGLGYTAIVGRLDLIVELYGSVPLEDGAERAMPIEVLAGLRVFLVGNSFLSIGATHGFLGNYGDPLIRPFAGIIFEPSVGDRDGDGVADDIDKCPDDPEDRDEWEDSDGCPDPDNDNDGILDINDLCPDLAEDMNGYEDEDGCPDSRRDRDRDGIIDSEDQCPDDPEDKDGFEDEDGCPELDNDRDGVPDSQDKCPLQPEDIDGFKDEDGCPDLDNDADGIPDNKDQCPNEPENYNGTEDEDGCPESGKKVIISGGKIRILDKVYFETAKAVIKTQSYDILYQVAETLRQNPQIALIEIQGHTDSRGSAGYNKSLSDKRAAAVRTFLINNGGINGGRLTSAGYGEEQPVDDEENADAWAKNRRVEFVIKKENAPEESPF